MHLEIMYDDTVTMMKEYEEGLKGSDNISSEEYKTPDDIYFDEHNEARAEQEAEEDLYEGDAGRE